MKGVLQTVGSVARLISRIGYLNTLQLARQSDCMIATTLLPVVISIFTEFLDYFPRLN